MLIPRDDRMVKDKLIELKYGGNCVGCGKRLKEGEKAYWNKGEGICCLECHPDSYFSSKIGVL